jgi:hypothetical protein
MRRPTYTLVLMPTSGDGVRELRALLKVALRKFSLRAISVRETTNTPPPRRSTVWCKRSSAQKVIKMDMRKYSGSTFLKTDDVRGGPLQERIASVVMGKYEKPDIVFESGDRLPVNATNNKALIRAYGIDSDAWIGHVVELSLGEIEYQGRPQEAVLVRPISKPKPEPDAPAKKAPKKAPPPSDFNDAVEF